MGPLLVFVCPCFRENVIVTCKIVSLLGSLDNCLLQNVIIFFLGGIKCQNGAHLKKKVIFDLLFTFLVTNEKTQNSISTYFTSIHTYIHTRVLLTLLTFFALPILQKLRIYHVWFLVGVTPGVDSFSRHFGAINK